MTEKQPETPQEDLDLEPETVQELEVGDGTADDVPGGRMAQTHEPSCRC